jgi:hypothetical protein
MQVLVRGRIEYSPTSTPFGRDQTVTTKAGKNRSSFRKIYPAVERHDCWSPQTTMSSGSCPAASLAGRPATATSYMVREAIRSLMRLEVWDLRDVHGSPLLQDTPGDALLGRLQVLLDEVPYETFPEEFVCWVHEVAAGGMKQLSDGSFEAHRELLRCLLLVGAKVFPLGEARGMVAVRFYSALLAWDALVMELRLVV